MCSSCQHILSVKPQTEKHVSGSDNFISVSIATARREGDVCLDESCVADQASERGELQMSNV